MENAEKILTKKNATFCCSDCDFICYKQSEWERHSKTKKHIHRNNGKCPKNEEMKKNAEYLCNCGKKYVSTSGLWKHKKICNALDKLDKQDKQDLKQEEMVTNNFAITPKMFYDLLKQNNELQKSLIAITSEKGPNINNNNYNNSNNNSNNNNSFNLNFFLNEQCKNAMNIMDFVNQLQVSVNDLEETGRLGFAQGISNIFINGLKQIDVSDRPIHCSDSKRETLYIKNNDQWNKETEDKIVLTNAIKHVAHKNMKQISEWQKIHPEYNDSDSKQNDKYLKIVSESMSGSSKEESNKNYEKIAKNIAKEVIIEK